MINKKARYLLLLILLFFPACSMLFPASDGGFSVMGTVVNSDREPLNNCSAELFDYNGKSLWGPDMIGSNFKTSYTVAPFKSTYSIEIKCIGYEPYSRVIEYGKDVSPSAPLKLGELVFKKIKE